MTSRLILNVTAEQKDSIVAFINFNDWNIEIIEENITGLYMNNALLLYYQQS